MADKLNTMFAEQQRFIGDASHELKTPLTSLMGACHVLSILDEQGTPDAKRRKTLETAERELSRMEELIADLLTLASNQEMNKPRVLDPISVNELLEGAIDASLATAMNRTIVYKPGREIFILGDQKALTRALRNLLDNALRYTPAEKEVSIAAKATDLQVSITVADQGCGIAPDHLEGLGKRFYRADSGRARVSGGTGLGLAITRAIAERHGGKLTITSQLTRGTNATIELPMRPVELVQE